MVQIVCEKHYTGADTLAVPKGFTGCRCIQQSPTSIEKGEIAHIHSCPYPQQSVRDRTEHKTDHGTQEVGSVRERHLDN